MIARNPQYPLSAFVRKDDGSSAVEFALVVPIMILLIFCIISIGGIMYSASWLHMATQDAARCGAVKLDICTSTTATQNYAQAMYKGPTADPNFVASVTATCSNVTATATYNIITGMNTFPVTLTAQACYPLQPTS